MELAAVDQWINELTDMCSASSRDQLITALYKTGITCLVLRGSY